MSETDATVSARPGLGIFYLAALLCAVGLLASVPIATEPGPADQGWWTAPSLMPLIGIGVWLLAGLYLVVSLARKVRSGRWRRPGSGEVRSELTQWLRPLEYFVYYVAYIFALGLVGYFLSTLAFIVGLGHRQGLRGRGWYVTGFLAALALVAIFRWGLRIWIDPAALYDLFPRSVRLRLARSF